MSLAYFDEAYEMVFVVCERSHGDGGSRRSTGLLMLSIMPGVKELSSNTLFRRIVFRLPAPIVGVRPCRISSWIGKLMRPGRRLRHDGQIELGPAGGDSIRPR